MWAPVDNAPAPPLGRARSAAFGLVALLGVSLLGLFWGEPGRNARRRACAIADAAADQ